MKFRDAFIFCSLPYKQAYLTIKKWYHFSQTFQNYLYFYKDKNYWKSYMSSTKILHCRPLKLFVNQIALLHYCKSVRCMSINCCIPPLMLKSFRTSLPVLLSWPWDPNQTQKSLMHPARDVQLHNIIFTQHDIYLNFENTAKRHLRFHESSPWMPLLVYLPSGVL